jgi:arabinan endo-1,5-alpha-L-arabinosidase
MGEPSPPEIGEGEYLNPVLPADAADPAVVRAADGTFYAYTTQVSTEGTGAHFPVLHSTDLVRWTSLGDAMPELPEWAEDGAERDTWAPHVIRKNGKYLMYFSARHAGADRLVIGVASSDDPAGPFEAIGPPLVGGSSIDPFVMQSSRGSFMYWTVPGEPIRVQPLSDDGLRLVGEPRMILDPDPEEPYQRLVEAPWVMQHGRYFYMFFSGNHCCGPGVHYATMVARSLHPRKGFQKYEGPPVLEANGSWSGPGHNAVVTDDAGQDWVLYHAIDPTDGDYDRYLMIDKITWRDGWPTINEGNGPTNHISEAPHIEARP